MRKMTSRKTQKALGGIRSRIIGVSRAFPRKNIFIPMMMTESTSVCVKFATLALKSGLASWWGCLAVDC